MLNVLSEHSFKQAVQYLLVNCFFKVGSQIFRQVIGIPIGSDPAPLFANLNGYIKWKNIYHHHARFGYVYRFINDMIAMDDNKEFQNSFKEIYQTELELKKKMQMII